MNAAYGRDGKRAFRAALFRAGLV